MNGCLTTPKHEKQIGYWVSVPQILITCSVTYFHHFLQFLEVAGDQVEEGELLEVLGPLVRHLDDLVVALQQGGLGQLLPARLVVKGSGRLQSNLSNTELSWDSVCTNSYRVLIFYIYFFVFFLSVCLSVCLPVCLPACLPPCLPVCLFVCLFIYLFNVNHSPVV